MSCVLMNVLHENSDLVAESLYSLTTGFGTLDPVLILRDPSLDLSDSSNNCNESSVSHIRADTSSETAL